MVFSSLPFLFFFLPVLLLLYAVVPKKGKNILLLLASLFFYAWGGPSYLLLMLASILLNYVVGLLLSPRIGAARKWVLALGVLINLGLLCYFKYTGFITRELHAVLSPLGWNFPIREIVLPIGISFYTFQAISYLVDLYRKEIAVQKNIFSLALYISFFPQLIAGPIVQYAQIEQDIRDRSVSRTDFSYGVKRFCFGLAKKVLLANELAWTADRIFSQPYENISTLIAWMGVLCYTFQIYYDFSGYSDMAIGLGRMFGFHFLENFRYPYLADSVSEFWRRWHISLSSWFKNYLYIPLGGSRRGLLSTCRNLLLVFLATGIWHGASWQFLLWGLYYGLLLIAERLFLGSFLKKHRIFAHFYTMLAVMIGWTVFRGNGFSGALLWLKKMFVFSGGNGSLSIGQFLDARILTVLFLAILFCGLLQKNKKLYQQLFCENKAPFAETLVLVLLLAACTVQLVSGTYNPFIYFRF